MQGDSILVNKDYWQQAQVQYGSGDISLCLHKATCVSVSF